MVASLKVSTKFQIVQEFIEFVTIVEILQMFLSIRHGLGVRIAGSHPAGPGSIPGAGNQTFLAN
jgi:hypothetical protein